MPHLNVYSAIESRLNDFSFNLCQEHHLRKAPYVAIHIDNEPYAYNHGYFISLSTGLLDLLTEKEVEEVMRHELAHSKNMGRDTFLKMLAPGAFAVATKKLALDKIDPPETSSRWEEAWKYSIAGVAGISSLFWLNNLTTNKLVERSADTIQMKDLGGDPEIWASALRKLYAKAKELGIRKGGAFDPHDECEERITKAFRIAAERDRKKKPGSVYGL